MQLVKMKSWWRRIGPSSKMMVGLRRRGDANRDIDTHTQAECHAKMKARMQGMLLEAREHPRRPANHQKPGERHGPDSSSSPAEGTSPADISILDFGPPELWDNMFLLLKPPALCGTLLQYP